MAITVSGDLSPRVGIFAAQEMLDHAKSVEILDKFGSIKALPANMGTKVKFRRLIPFTARMTPLIEGVTPPSTPFGSETVEVDIRQYGDWSEITDVIMDTYEDPILAEMTQLHGENIGRTKEATAWATLRAGTNVFYTGTATARTGVNEPVTRSKQRAITRSLKANKATKIRRVLSGSDKVGTQPIEAAFIAVAHTNLESDIRNMEGFIPTAKYGTRDMICPEEIGSVEDVRYILSPDLDPFADAGGAKAGGSGAMVSTAGVSADVYPILYMGTDAFGVVPLRGQNAIQPIVRNPKAESTDPLAQRGSVGWKGYWAHVILDDSWMIRLESAATDL